MRDRIFPYFRDCVGVWNFSVSLFNFFRGRIAVELDNNVVSVTTVSLSVPRERTHRSSGYITNMRSAFRVKTAQK